MITSNAEAIERLKQSLDNIDDEIETHVRERDFFIVSSVVTSKPANEGHFKTGQRRRRAGQGFLLLYG
jgi:hypothetical protein